MVSKKITYKRKCKICGKYKDKSEVRPMLMICYDCIPDPRK